MTPTWLKFTPSGLRDRIAHRTHLLKAVSNTGWLFADHVVRMAVGLVIGVWMARYLGPEQFGLLNYAMAFVALFAVFANLGLNSIVVRELVKHPQDSDTTLGSAFVLQTIGSILALALIVVAIVLIRPEDEAAKLIVAVLGLSMLFKPSGIVQCWFESQVQSKYSVWVENSVFLTFSAVKVALIILQAPLMAFVWAVLAEALFVAAGLFGIYAWQGGRLSAWQHQFQRARTLLRDGWPLILSGLAVMTYMRIDQIMLGQMLGDEAVGVYSAAVRISEAWYFVPAAIGASVFPAIIKARKQGEEIYYRNLQKLYDLMVLVALCVAVPMTFVSRWLVELLFGNGYQAAAPVLSISIWSGLGVAMSVIHGKWLLAEGLQKYSLLYAIAGALINVMLNLYLIPRHGLVGAAWATLCAQIAPIFLQLFIPSTRRNFRLMMHAMFVPYRYLFKRQSRSNALP